MTHTDSGILKHNVETCVILPLDAEPATGALPFCEGGLDVLCLELLREASQGEDARHGRGEPRDGGRHRACLVTDIKGCCYRFTVKFSV